MPKVYDPYIPYIWAAMSSRFGVRVVTTNVKLSQAHIYAARKSIGDPDLDRLQVRPDPKDLEGAIWIIKGPKKEEVNG